jgi:hypothetical protein
MLILWRTKDATTEKIWVMILVEGVPKKLYFDPCNKAYLMEGSLSRQPFAPPSGMV